MDSYLPRSAMAFISRKLQCDHLFEPLRNLEEILTYNTY